MELYDQYPCRVLLTDLYVQYLYRRLMEWYDQYHRRILQKECSLQFLSHQMKGMIVH